jgi:predicted acylesterase/phospholipase RssA
MPNGEASADRSIDLILSGGGFRATLFHLGVVRYLVESRQLCKVGRIYSVSGGSVLASHLAMNWDRYSSVDTFDSAAQELLSFVRSNLRGRIVRRCIAYWAAICAVFVSIVTAATFAFKTGVATTVLITIALLLIVLALWLCDYRRFVMVNIFEQELAAFLARSRKLKGNSGPVLLKALEGRPGTSPPKFALIATNLTTGSPWAFTSDGVTWFDDERWNTFVHEYIPLSQAVAASAAFPPLFSPVVFARKLDPNRFQLNQYLADGGIYDNLGVVTADALSTAENRVDSDRLAIISSAERLFERNSTDSFGFLHRRAARSADISMGRVSELNCKNFSGIYIRISEDSEAIRAAMPIAIQRLVRNIRTDLDDFSPSEIQLLVFKGYLTAWVQLDRTTPPVKKFSFNDFSMPTNCETDHWLPVTVQDLLRDINPAETLADSHKRRASIFDWRDWEASLVLALAIVCILALNPLSASGLQWAWNHIPSTPMALEGTWYMSRTRPDELANDEWLDSLFKSKLSGDRSSGIIFLSERLSDAYGLWPRGAFTWSVSLADSDTEFRIPVAAFLVDGTHRFESLNVDRAGDAYLVAVPSGRTDARLCFCISIERGSDTTFSKAELQSKLHTSVLQK